MAPLGLNIEECLRNVFRNHGRHVFRQDLWITIVVIFNDYLLKLLKKPSESVSPGVVVSSAM